MAYWLAKTEPSECSIEDLERSPSTPIVWEGVRNYQARNFLKAMSVGDEVLVYHSSCAHIGIAGSARVTRAAYPDPSQFDLSSPYHDPKSPADAPRWVAVDMIFKQRFSQLLSLDTLKAQPGLEALALVKRGNRLSVMPMTDEQYRLIETL